MRQNWKKILLPSKLVEREYFFTNINKKSTTCFIVSRQNKQIQRKKNWKKKVTAFLSEKQCQYLKKEKEGKKAFFFFGWVLLQIIFHGQSYRAYLIFYLWVCPFAWNFSQWSKLAYQDQFSIVLVQSSIVTNFEPGVPPLSTFCFT